MQILRQPDNRFAVFDGRTGTIVVFDATADEVVGYFADQAAEDSRTLIRPIVHNVASGKPEHSYGPRTLTWERALVLDREHGGEVWRVFEAVSTDNAIAARVEAAAIRANQKHNAVWSGDSGCSCGVAYSGDQRFTAWHQEHRVRAVAAATVRALARNTFLRRPQGQDVVTAESMNAHLAELADLMEEK